MGVRWGICVVICVVIGNLCSNKTCVVICVVGLWVMSSNTIVVMSITCSNKSVWQYMYCCVLTCVVNICSNLFWMTCSASKWRLYAVHERERRGVGIGGRVQGESKFKRQWVCVGCCSIVPCRWVIYINVYVFALGGGGARRKQVLSVSMCLWDAVQ